MGTTYKGLYLPGTSEINWTATLNANFSALADRVTAPIFLSAADGINQAGAAPSTIGAFPNQSSYHSLLNGATNGATWITQLPQDCSAGIRARPFWFPSATDAVAHAVRWSFDVRKINLVDIGSSAAAVNDIVAWTGGSTTRSALVTVLEEVAGTSTALVLAAGDIFRFTISRIGADALDTYVGNVQLLGLQIEYV